MSRFTVIGTFDFKNLSNGGQPVKTRNLYKLLSEKYGTDEVSFIETYGWKKHPFRIINAVKFRTANESNVVADEILMKIAIGISGAICCNEQVCTLKVRSLDRDKLDLHRPLTKLRGQGKAKVCGSFVCRVCSVINLPCTASGAAACRKCRRVSL